MEALITLLPAALAFYVGVRLGPKRANIALRIALVATLAFALLARYVNALPDREWYMVAWIAIIAGAFLMCAVALTGPSIFKRCLYALTLSVAVLTLIKLTVSREMLVSFLTGSIPP